MQALDVLRVLRREPAAGQALLDEVERARGADARLDAAVAALGADLRTVDESSARRLVERMALVLQASLLVRCAPAAVADAFCAGRLGDDGRLAFGTLPSGVDTAALLVRAAY